MQNIDELISLALKEDIGEGDHTSLSTIPTTAKGRAKLLIKEDGIIAGVNIAKKVFKQVDENFNISIFLSDGQKIKKRDIVFEIEGNAISILTAERTVLNYMQRMSGIATYTNLMVSLLDGLNTKILDTRKTTPLMRIFEKMAVEIGGGQNHRFGLYDMIMIKDNHIDFAGGIEKAIIKTIEYLKLKNLKLKIEVETRNINEVKEVLSVGGIDRIMLDNFTLDDMRKAVILIDRKYETEASGGITMKTIRSYAETGVDFISVGALTHHINSLDMSLKAM